MDKMEIEFNLKVEPIETKWHPLEEAIENPDFLSVLANSYDFEEFDIDDQRKAERKLNKVNQRKAEMYKQNKRLNKKDQRKAEKWTRRNVDHQTEKKNKQIEEMNYDFEKLNQRNAELIDRHKADENSKNDITRQKIETTENIDENYLKNELCGFIESYQKENQKNEDEIEIDWKNWCKIEKEIETKHNVANFYQINEKYEKYNRTIYIGTIKYQKYQQK